MPKRTDITSIMVIGSGPIVIGQAAEFDYSGTQACKALREEGYTTILVNSNPATIMTDADTADVVYVEPLDVEIVADIIRKEKPDGILGTMGGQTGLNLMKELHHSGVLEEVGVEVLGTSIDSIEKGEDRDKFRELMLKIGEPLPKSRALTTIAEAKAFAAECGFPVIIRPAYTLGGTGGGIASDEAQLEAITASGLQHSLIHQVLIEEALLGTQGWGEFEMEVMRDSNENCIIICPMENLDPMGIHTGESIVVAPTQTLNDADFQMLRNAALRVIRALKIEGGCNIQFALNYETGRYIIIEVNPRVSRSSALASKATGYPIARIAAKIAIGMTLDEIPNDVTKETKACFEPAIDYCVVKIPRWPFDKFVTADCHIGTQMKSTGEAMAIGRTFEEAFQKAVRSLEIKRFGLCCDGKDKPVADWEMLIDYLKRPTHRRMFHVLDAFSIGMSIDEVHGFTGINRWFLHKLAAIHAHAKRISFDRESILAAKKAGFSDVQIGHITRKSEAEVRSFRVKEGIIPTYKMVDTCAAEFEAKTPYLYSTYEGEDECNPGGKKKVLILGSGPIRIGQGIEFDYSCVHSAFALREEGVEALIINNNPETVSTDFDTSDKLFFEPLTFEDVMNVVDCERPYGVILQFGGQTAMDLALDLEKAGAPILGTRPESIDIAEDRKKFGRVTEKLGIPSPEWGAALSPDEAIAIANRIGYPVLVRPSYVLGGRAMQIVDLDEELMRYMDEAVDVSPEKPVLIDRFIGNATELDVDALSDGEEVYVAAIMEHIERAGIHSGDSCCVIPSQTIGDAVKKKVISYTTRLAKELRVIGLINIQYAVKNEEVYVLEANPRASRTVPYVSKTIGVPLAKIATKLMLGKKLADFSLGKYREPDFVSIKEAVFPFLKLVGVDPMLSPEMKSTGEVIGIGRDFGSAYYKAQLAAYQDLPTSGSVLFSISHLERTESLLAAARELQALGFKFYCTRGTAEYFAEHGIHAVAVPKIHDGPLILDMMKSRKLDFAILIPKKGRIGSDGYQMRRAAIELGIPYATTVAATIATVAGMKAKKESRMQVLSLKEWYGAH